MPRCRAAVVILFLVPAAIISAQVPALSPRALADDSTPAPVVLTPEPTLAPTPAPTPQTSLPTVTQERSTPIATVAQPTVAVQPIPTPTTVSEQQVPTPSSVVPLVQPTPVSAVNEPPPPSVSWPSAADLQQNARLRWGTRIPNAVRRWAFLIVPAAHRYNLDPNLIAAVMTMESNGDPLAQSWADARGLMQILHGPWDPHENVFVGARMLADLYAQFGDWRLALAGYNAGAGAVIDAGGIPPIRETRDYVIVVMYLWDLYSHRRLSGQRKSEYRRTLRDLRNYADQRKKIKRLAAIGQIPGLLDLCSSATCGAPSPADASFETLDPFWPAAGAPDPLQRVDPYSASP